MINRVNTNSRMSQVVIHGDTVYLAGQVADDATADVKEQTRQVLSKVEKLLSDAGSDTSKMLSATIWLTDIGDFAAMNEIWDGWVPANAAPARACVEAALAFEGLKVEVGVIAAK
jgi:enamine deaminase RidA (YjgF/YER057c/UK114 family)